MVIIKLNNMTNRILEQIKAENFEVGKFHTRVYYIRFLFVLIHALSCTFNSVLIYVHAFKNFLHDWHTNQQIGYKSFSALAKNSI